MNNPIDRWMVQRNLEYVKTEGLETVIQRLESQGYFKVANAVKTCVTESTLVNHENQQNHKS